MEEGILRRVNAAVAFRPSGVQASLYLPANYEKGKQYPRWSTSMSG